MFDVEIWDEVPVKLLGFSDQILGNDTAETGLCRQRGQIWDNPERFVLWVT